ncbi:cationic trypsin-3-like [Teleopsis dalmanni]|uniref:cationic trypsin-3-like n=1 Tax=Teleopsis dalmanni TaxID=139649 RepID=UPI0018CFA431|nr:cationic trypsin-3-like [Teleopsis dalmanni]
MGSSYLYDKTMHTQSYDVMKVVATPGFELALLFINGDIPKESTVIMPIQFSKVEQKTGTKCNLTTWTRSTNNITTLSSMLAVTKMRLENNAICSTYYANSTANTFCAESLYGPGATCQADIGAPLVCNGTLVGITNWNAICNKNDGYPTIFTNISNYYAWIVHANSTLDYTQYRNAALGFLNSYNLLCITVALIFLFVS